MPRPFYAVIIPLGEAPNERPGRPVDPGYGVDEGAYPDHELPGGPPPHVGNRPPGSRPEYPSTGPVRPGRPVDPGFGWGGGEHPANRPPGGGRPPRPGQGLPGGRPGGRPDNALPGEGGPDYPSNELPPELGPPVGPIDPWEPPPGQELPPPPQDIVDKVVVAVWRPADQAWKVGTAEDGGSNPA